jgi:hypothetical protein
VQFEFPKDYNEYNAKKNDLKDEMHEGWKFVIK